MKEYDEIRKNDGQIGEPGKNDPAGMYRELYESLTDIPSRVRFLLGMQQYIVGTKEIRGTSKPEDETAYETLAGEFTEKYLKNGSPDQQRKIFQTLALLKAENDLGYYETFKKEYSKYKETTAHRQAKAMWVADQTGPGIKKTYINGMIKSFSEALPGGTHFNSWMSGAKEEFLEEHKLSPQDEHAFREISEATQKQISYKEIEDWTEGRGRQIAGRSKRDAMRLQNTTFEDLYMNGRDPGTIDPVEESTRLKNEWKQLQTLEDKLRFMKDVSVYSICIALQYGVRYSLDETLTEMKEEFKEQYISNGTLESAKEVFGQIGKMMAEEALEILPEIKKQYDRMQVKDLQKDKMAVKKGNLLAFSTQSGIAFNAISDLNKEMQAAFHLSEKVARAALKETGVSKNITMAEFGRLMGESEKTLPVYLEKNKVKPEDKAVQVRMAKKKQSELEAYERIKDDVLRKQPLGYTEKAKDSFLKEMEQDPEKGYVVKENKKLLEHIIFVGSTERSESGLEEWLKTKEGLKREEIEKDTYYQVINDRVKKQDRSVSYEQYIRLHTGTEITRAGEEKQAECLAKAFAADILKERGAEFSLKQIHRLADTIKKEKGFADLMKDKEAVKSALCGVKPLGECRIRLMGPSAKTPLENISGYIDDMSSLYGNMMPSKKRSREYQALHKAVKKIADLKGKYDMNNEKDRLAAEKEIMKLNVNLVSCITAYTDGKEKTRFTDDGKERFNNAVDALAILSRNAPSMQQHARVFVTNINRIRKVEEGHEKFVNLDDFGTERARQAKIDRDIKKTKQSPKTL
nr:hypothetical protein [Lachnospiraceae bacterium]